MKKIIFLSMMSVVLFASCLSDNDNSYDTSTIVAELGDVYTNSSIQATYAITDDNVKLEFSNKATVDWMTKGDSCYRCIIYYNKETGASTASSTQKAKLQALTKILTLQLTSPKDAEKWSSYHDGVKFESGWRKSRYVNLSLQVPSGTSTNSHIFGLVSDSTVTKSTGKIHYMTLCHNQNNIPKTYYQSVYLSIPTKDFSATDSIYVNIMNENNQVVTYKY